MDQRPRLRRRDRRVQPAARTGVDAARHLLGVAGRRHRRCDRRRRRVHRPRAGDHPRPRRAVPRGRATDLGPRRRRRRRRGGRRGRGARRHRPRPAEPRPRERPLAVGALRDPRRDRGRDRSVRGSCSCSSRADSPRSPSTPSDATRKLGRHLWPALAATATAATGGLPRLGVGRVQGRRALVRRRVRDHPAHASRRRQPLPLDDQRAVPRRRRPRPSHARTRRANRRRRRLRRGRHRRWSPRRVRRVHSRRSRSCSSARPGSTASATTRAHARSSTAPVPPPSARSSASRSRSRSRSAKPGSTRSSPPRASRSFRSDAPSSSRSSAQASSVPSRPGSARRFPRSAPTSANRRAQYGRSPTTVTRSITRRCGRKSLLTQCWVARLSQNATLPGLHRNRHCTSGIVAVRSSSASSGCASGVVHALDATGERAVHVDRLAAGLGMRAHDRDARRSGASRAASPVPRPADAARRRGRSRAARPARRSAPSSASSSRS